MGGINSTRYVIYLHTFFKREDVTLIPSLEVSEMVFVEGETIEIYHDEHEQNF